MPSTRKGDRERGASARRQEGSGPVQLSPPDPEAHAHAKHNTNDFTLTDTNTNTQPCAGNQPASCVSSRMQCGRRASHWFSS